MKGQHEEVSPNYFFKIGKNVLIQLQANWNIVKDILPNNLIAYNILFFSFLDYYQGHAK
jgi:hypothetical protein